MKVQVHTNLFIETFLRCHLDIPTQSKRFGVWLEVILKAVWCFFFCGKCSNTILVLGFLFPRCGIGYYSIIVILWSFEYLLFWAFNFFLWVSSFSLQYMLIDSKIVVSVWESFSFPYDKCNNSFRNLVDAICTMALVPLRWVQNVWERFLKRILKKKNEKREVSFEINSCYIFLLHIHFYMP